MVTSLTERLAPNSALWYSIAAVDCVGALSTLDSDRDLPHEVRDQQISARVQQSLEYADMAARESQIKDPFPDTFQWLLGEGDSEAREPTGFEEWLESMDDGKTPFWITGKPASGKSTLMKFICTNPKVKSHLLRWSGELPLLRASVYFWNPGSLAQKTQEGLLRTILSQLLAQQPELCRIVAPKHYLYYQLAGAEAHGIPEWTADGLQESIAQFVSHVQDTHRLAIFVDGLDEYSGDLEGIVLYLKELQDNKNIKLCVSSRPWNIFKDAFRTYPSLRMEQLTRPDIEKYVKTRMADSIALQELRAVDGSSVDKLEMKIIDEAQGVFLWVVLVVERVIATARDNNHLDEIWQEFKKLPPGLDELYASILQGLDSSLRRRSSTMHQILRRWVQDCGQNMEVNFFWVALHCHDPRESPQFPQDQESSRMLPLLERQLTGATGGMLQVIRIKSDARPRGADVVQYAHRTVYDWLMGVWNSILGDGPKGYDPSLTIAAALVSGLPALVREIEIPVMENTLKHNSSMPAQDENHAVRAFRSLMVVGRHCTDSPESRSALLHIFQKVTTRELEIVGKYLLETHELRTLQKHMHSNIKPLTFFALRYACAPYVQAQFENNNRGEADLHMPRRLLVLPKFLWDADQRQLLALFIDVALSCCDTADVDLLNLKLDCFKALAQAEFAPGRYLFRRVQDEIKKDSWPRDYYQALLAGLKGKGYEHLASIQDDDKRRGRSGMDEALLRVREDLAFLERTWGANKRRSRRTSAARGDAWLARRES